MVHYDQVATFGDDDCLRQCPTLRRIAARQYLASYWPVTACADVPRGSSKRRELVDTSLQNGGPRDP